MSNMNGGDQQVYQVMWIALSCFSLAVFHPISNTRGCKHSCTEPAHYLPSFLPVRHVTPSPTGQWCTSLSRVFTHRQNSTTIHWQPSRAVSTLAMTVANTQQCMEAWPLCCNHTFIWVLECKQDRTTHASGNHWAVHGERVTNDHLLLTLLKSYIWVLLYKHETTHEWKAGLEKV